MNREVKTQAVATQNACNLCTPLGACFVFKGIEQAVPFLHGSQGCSTYIRRYMIGHFREPVDIASSNFSESTAIFGGKQNLTDGLRNVIAQYNPSLVGVATTCLAETIGEDVTMIMHDIRRDAANNNTPLPPVVTVSTPSYNGTHMDGFHAAVRATLDTLAEGGSAGKHINLLPGFVSPADLRYLKEIIADFGIDATLLPDYSETLDGGTWDSYQRLSPGGTTVDAIRQAGSACATVEFGCSWDNSNTAGALLDERFGVSRFEVMHPIGIGATDHLFSILKGFAGKRIPDRHIAERSRLIDSYIDAHKHVFGKRAIVYGEEDLVIAIAAFLAEIGVIPVLCASGGRSAGFANHIRKVTADIKENVLVHNDTDFIDIEQTARELEPDFIIGSSKGFKTASALNIPLVRVGFPIHDRIDGARTLHLGYRGTQQLFDRIVNTIIETKQAASPVGYTYM